MSKRNSHEGAHRQLRPAAVSPSETASSSSPSGSRTSSTARESSPASSSSRSGPSISRNALKFTPKGGSVSVRVERVGTSIDLHVKDDGQGIHADFLPHVFERFRQADGSTTSRHGGLGLGLALVRHLAEAHGGVVRAESDGEGRGSTFTVTLPVQAVFPENVEAMQTPVRTMTVARALFPTACTVSASSWSTTSSMHAISSPRCFVVRGGLHGPGHVRVWSISGARAGCAKSNASMRLPVPSIACGSRAVMKGVPQSSSNVAAERELASGVPSLPRFSSMSLAQTARRRTAT